MRGCLLHRFGGISRGTGCPEESDLTSFGDYHRYQHHQLQLWTMQVLGAADTRIVVSRKPKFKLIDLIWFNITKIDASAYPASQVRYKTNHPEILWLCYAKSKKMFLCRSNQLYIFEMLRSRQGMKWAAPSAIYKFMQPPPSCLLLRPLQISSSPPCCWDPCTFLASFLLRPLKMSSSCTIPLAPETPANFLLPPCLLAAETPTNFLSIHLVIKIARVRNSPDITILSMLEVVVYVTTCSWILVAILHTHTFKPHYLGHTHTFKPPV